MTAIGAKFKLFLKCEDFILGNQSCYTVARGYILIMFSDGSIKYNQTSGFHLFDWLPELSVFVLITSQPVRVVWKMISWFVIVTEESILIYKHVFITFSRELIS